MGIQESIKFVEKYGVKALGKKELIKYLEKKRITPMEAIIAKCYDCMGYFIDGRNDCKAMNCPLHCFMQYNPKRSKRTLSEGQKISLSKALQSHRSKNTV